MVTTKGRRWKGALVALPFLLVMVLAAMWVGRVWSVPPPSDTGEQPDLVPVQYFDVTNVGRIAYWKVAATAPRKAAFPMVYLAGGPGDGIDKFEALDFSRRYTDFDIYFLDQISVGASDRLARSALTLENSVEAINEFSTQIIGGQVVLVGGSWGAAIATRFAIAHPERVRGLLLLAPAGLPEVCSVPSLETTSICSIDKLPNINATLKPYPLDRLEAPNGAKAAVITPSKPTVIPDGRFGVKFNRMHLAHLVTPLSPYLSRLMVPLKERRGWEEHGINVEVNKVLWKHHRSSSMQANKLSSDLPTLILRGDLDFVPISEIGGYQALFPKARFVEFKNETHAIEQSRCAPTIEARVFLATYAGAAMPKSCANFLVPSPQITGGYTLQTELKF